LAITQGLIDYAACSFDYSSVSTVIERTKKKAGTERAFRKRIEKLKMDLTAIKGTAFGISRWNGINWAPGEALRNA